MNSSYMLNFVIPQGPTGATGATGLTGPTGPANGLNAYGGRYNNTSQVLNLGIGTTTVVPLEQTMSNLNTSYATENSIVVQQAGVYEINY